MAGKLGLLIVLLSFLLLALYPAWQILSVALQPDSHPFATPVGLIPQNATLNNFTVLFTSAAFKHWLLQSLLVAFSGALTTVALASIIASAISRRQPGVRASTPLLLIAALLLLPAIIFLVRLELLGSYFKVLLFSAATALPFCIWLCKGTYDSVSPALLEAARVDGCSSWQRFYHVTLPSVLSGLAIVSLFSLLTSWCGYGLLSLTRNAPELRPALPAATGAFWGVYASLALIFSIPALLMFLILSQQFLSEKTRGR